MPSERSAGATARVERSLPLAQGRRIGFAQWGHPSGKPVVVLHGLPGSRLCAAALHGEARRVGLRVLTPERPGFGLSSPAPRHSITTWAEDLRHFAEALELESFALVGVSAGAPFALAAAARLGTRLDALALVSGLGRLDDPAVEEGMEAASRLLWRLARSRSRALAAACLLYAPLARRFPMRLFFAAFDLDSRRLLRETPTLRRALVADLREALCQGHRPVVAELGLLARDWGFACADIEVPVRLWHGSADGTCPLRMAQRLAEELPRGRLSVLRGEGHLMAFRHLREILSGLS